MNRNRTLAAILIVVGITFTTFACVHDDKSPSSSQAHAVVVAIPQRGTITRSLRLPGDLVGFYQSPLYAKVTGYVKSIAVDKGDWVKGGQVLAEIEVPE